MNVSLKSSEWFYKSFENIKRFECNTKEIEGTSLETLIESSIILCKSNLFSEKKNIWKVVNFVEEIQGFSENGGEGCQMKK